MITIKNPMNSGMSPIFEIPNKYVVLDWSNVIRRAYHTTGEHKALELLIFMLAKIKRGHPDSHVVVALEGTGRLVRAQQFPPYKANRKPDKVFDEVAVKCLKLLDFVECTQIKAPKGEADDAIACFVKKMCKGEQALIISEDRDLWQLVKDNSVTVEVRKFGIIDERKCKELMVFHQKT